MKGVLNGQVIKFGDNINTDIISPPQYMEYSIEEGAVYAMSRLDPEFYKKVKLQSIMVAGLNFGSGSSRETSPLTLKYLGVQAIIAKSFARIFYRNSINVGLIVLECPDTDKISDFDVLEINYLDGVISNMTKKERYSCTQIPKHLLRIIQNGGLIPHLRNTLN
jgi:3-isopropylmalate/(R)-2-methylmalate dehydratase small subunit